MQIFVRSLSGATVTVEASACDSVAVACEKLCAKEGFECDDLRMVFQGKALDMSSSLSEYSIEHGAHRCPE